MNFENLRLETEGKKGYNVLNRRAGREIPLPRPGEKLTIKK